MTLIGTVIVVALVFAQPGTLVVEKVSDAGDPRAFSMLSPLTGDRGVPASCTLGDGTTVTLVKGQDATLEVVRGGVKKALTIPDVRGQARPTLACGDDDRFFYVNPRYGRVFGYSANRLLGGEEPIVWSRSVTPFTSLPDAG